MLIQRVGLEIARLCVKESDKKDQRFAGIQIDDRARVSATDGMAWLRMDASVREPDLFVADAFADIEPMRAHATILPADVVSDFLGASKLANAEQVVLDIDDADPGKATLCTRDSKAVRMFLAEPKDYAPLDFDKVSRHDGQPAVVVTLSVKLLLKTLRTIAACGGESVRLTIWDGISVINLRSHSCEPGSFRALIDGGIMPMRDPDADEQTTTLPSTTGAPNPPPVTPLFDDEAPTDRKSAAAGEGGEA